MIIIFDLGANRDMQIFAFKCRSFYQVLFQTALCTCFRISLLLLLPIDTIVCLWNAKLLVFTAAWGRPSQCFISICTNFLQYFFNNRHAFCVGTKPYTFSLPFFLHTHPHTRQTEIKANSVLGLLVLLRSCPLPLLSYCFHSWKRRLALNSGLWYGNVMVVEKGVGHGGREVNSSEWFSWLDCFHCKGNVLCECQFTPPPPPPCHPTKTPQLYYWVFAFVSSH